MDFWRTGVSYPKKAFSRVWTLERVRADRAGGQCLRLRVDAHPPHEQGAGRAGGQCRWLRIHAPKPHEQGAWVLRFVSVPAAERIHGGRPTSRGRPPAAVGGWETGENGRWFPKKGFSRVWIDCQASATASKKTSKGVRQPSRLRGLWLIRSKTRSNSACDTSRKLQPRG